MHVKLRAHFVVEDIGLSMLRFFQQGDGHSVKDWGMTYFS